MIRVIHEWHRQASEPARRGRVVRESHYELVRSRQRQRTRATRASPSLEGLITRWQEAHTQMRDSKLEMCRFPSLFTWSCCCILFLNCCRRLLSAVRGNSVAATRRGDESIKTIACTLREGSMLGQRGIKEGQAGALEGTIGRRLPPPPSQETGQRVRDALD